MAPIFFLLYSKDGRTFYKIELIAFSKVKAAE